MLQTLDSYLRLHYAAGDRYAEQLRVAVHCLNRWAGHGVSASELSDDLLLRFLRDYSRGRAASTCNSKRRALLTLWRHAAQSGTAARTSGIVPARPEPRRLPEAWTVAEIERLISTARSWPGMVGTIPRRYWWPSLLLAVYDSGCRIGAMLQARSSDCSLGERSIFIRAEVTKTQTDRLYWMHDQTIAAIASHYDAGRELLWPWPHGSRWFFSQMRWLVTRAGLPAGRSKSMGLFHKIRRTNISYCAASSLSLAQQQAGHADPRLTVARYIDPRISRTQSAVDVLPRPGF